MMCSPSPLPGLRPVVTPLGKLWGRDCIFLEERRFEASTGMLVLAGEINGPLCDPRQRAKWIGYEVRFKGVVAHTVHDVDDPRGPKHGWSSFCEDIHSGLKRPLRRYFFATYDDVFVVDCTGFVFIPGSMRDENGDPVALT